MSFFVVVFTSHVFRHKMIGENNKEVPMSYQKRLDLAFDQVPINGTDQLSRPHQCGKKLFDQTAHGEKTCQLGRKKGTDTHHRPYTPAHVEPGCISLSQHRKLCPSLSDYLHRNRAGLYIFPENKRAFLCSFLILQILLLK